LPTLQKRKVFAVRISYYIIDAATIPKYRPLSLLHPLQTPELVSWLFLAGIIVVVVAGDKPKAIAFAGQLANPFACRDSTHVKFFPLL
jgi:hypothetical protein